MIAVRQSTPEMRFIAEDGGRTTFGRHAGDDLAAGTRAQRVHLGPYDRREPCSRRNGGSLGHRNGFMIHRRASRQLPTAGSRSRLNQRCCLAPSACACFRHRCSNLDARRRHQLATRRAHRTCSTVRQRLARITALRHILSRQPSGWSVHEVRGAWGRGVADAFAGAQSPAVREASCQWRRSHHPQLNKVRTAQWDARDELRTKAIAAEGALWWRTVSAGRAVASACSVLPSITPPLWLYSPDRSRSAAVPDRGGG